MLTKTSLIEMLSCKIEYAETRLQAFHKDFAHDSASALDNCDNMFEFAAQKKVFSQVRKTLKEGKVTLEYVQAYVQNEVNSKASYVKKCTSVTATLFHVYTTQAWADALAILNHG